MKTQAWDVLLKIPAAKSYGTSAVTVNLPVGNVEGYLHRRTTDFDFFLVDTVFFDADMDRKQVRKSLIDHDGYPSNIVVDKVKQYPSR